VFTNLSRDHIDYHGSMAAYGNSKARLFLEHRPAHCVIGLDSEFGAVLADRCGDDAILVASSASHARGRHPYLFATAVDAMPDGTVIDIDSSWGRGRCRLPLVGSFNVANAAQVLAVLMCHDLGFDSALDLLGTATAPPGRMQRVVTPGPGNGPAVFVDYAHTPAALEAALQALRPHCHGALWCVFGCGGDRDRGKRALMGAVVEELADRPVITSDNPRSEEPAAIIRDVQRGMHRDATVIEDRAAAIARVIGSAAEDDVVLIAGKGHENYQVIGTQRIEFSDYAVAEANLRTAAARHAPQ